MPLWIIFALASVLTMAIAELAQKFVMVSKDNISAEANNFVVWNFQALWGLLFLLIFVNSPVPHLNYLFFLKLVLLSVIYFWGGTFYYSSYKGNSAGLSAILITISVIVSTTLGIIFFNESSSFQKFIGLFLVITALIIVNLNRSEKFNKYSILALSGGLLYGFAFTLDKSFVLQINPHLYLPIFCFSVGWVGLLFRGKTIVTDLKKISGLSLRTMVLSSLGGFAFNTFTFLSYINRGDVGRVDAINNLAIILIIIFEIIIFKQKTELIRKIAAALVAITGLYLLGTAI